MMEIISQTNRTILLDVINLEKPDLLTLAGEVKGIDHGKGSPCRRSENNFS